LVPCARDEVVDHERVTFQERDSPRLQFRAANTRSVMLPPRVTLVDWPSPTLWPSVVASVWVSEPPRLRVSSESTNR